MHNTLYSGLADTPLLPTHGYNGQKLQCWCNSLHYRLLVLRNCTHLIVPNLFFSHYKGQLGSTMGHKSIETLTCNSKIQFLSIIQGHIPPPPPTSTHPLPKISRFSKSDLIPGSSLEKYMPGKVFLRAQWYLDRVRGKSIANWPNGIKIGPAVNETR